MSDGKLFARSKSSELKAELDQAFKKSKPQARVKIVLKKVVANIILNNNELVSLFPDIVSLMKFDDLEIRKLCFHYIVAYAPMHVTAAYEALPFFQRFIKEDSNPLLRALSIRTLSSVPNKAYVDLMFQLCAWALTDKDAHVRKTSCYAVSKLYQHDARRTTDSGLIDNLNDLLYDSDPVVVSNALAALSFITDQGKTLTLTIDKRHALSLCSYLSKVNEWCQVYLLNALTSYVPQTSEEAMDLIDAVMPSLQHENSAVVLDTIKVIVYYSNYIRHPESIFPTLPKRLGSSLVSLLSKKPEIQFLVLRNVILLLLGKRELLTFDVQMFFCRYDEPIYVKDTKLEIIYLLANEGNAPIVLRELEEYATEVDVSMARKAIRAIGNLAVKLPSVSDQCVEVLVDLISNGMSYIVQESAIVIKNILRRYPAKYNFAITELLRHYKLIDETDSKTALIWILGQYCTEISNAAEIIEYLTNNFKDEPTEVQYASLTTATKLYFQVPEKGEKLVLRVLKCATEEVDNPDVRDRGFFYWRLISAEGANGPNGEFQANTKRILLNTKLSITTDSDKIDPEILEELELNIGTLASIYLKPVHHVFRLAKKKQLIRSPALQARSPTYSGSESPTRESSSTPNSMGDTAVNSTTGTAFTGSRPSRFGSQKRQSITPEPIVDAKPTQDPPATESFAKRLTRKASLIKRKGSKY
ncbi:AP-2 complex subunit beta [[Candida] anglica]